MSARRADSAAEDVCRRSVSIFRKRPVDPVATVPGAQLNRVDSDGMATDHKERSPSRASVVRMTAWRTRQGLNPRCGSLATAAFKAAGGFEDTSLLHLSAPCRTFQTSAAVRPMRSVAQRLEQKQSALAGDREQRHWLLQTHLRHVSASLMPPGSRGTRQDTCFSVSSTPESSLATSCGETFLLRPRQQSRSSARRLICRERAAP